MSVPDPALPAALDARTRGWAGPLRRLCAVLGAGAVLVTGGLAAAPARADDGRTFTQMLAQLRLCESGGNYAINTGNGYYGAYQFDIGTWYAVGGTGLPSANSPATQDEMATRLYEQRGWAPWPSCSRSQGLYPVPVQRPGSAPAGHVDAVSGTRGGITVTGWALDVDNDPGPVWVDVLVDTVTTRVAANLARPDVNAVLGVPGEHGLAATVPATPGPHHVCVTAIGAGGGAASTLLWCGDGVVVPSPPVGSVDRVQVMKGGDVHLSGWALDPDTSATRARVHVYSDGVLVRRLWAGKDRPDVDAALGVTGAHGYDLVVPAAAVVCVYALDSTGTADNALLGCRAPTS